MKTRSHQDPRRAFIDLKGVMIHHRTGRALPLMASLIGGLMREGWQVNVLTSHHCNDAEWLIREQQFPDGMHVISSAGKAKGIVLREEIRKTPGATCLFLDDKSANLASVKRECGDMVRTVGCIGSRRYCPQLSEWCFRSGVELALSVPDLFEGLAIYCNVSGGLVGATSHLSEDDIALLIPGLDHPFSAIAGETFHFDHRAVMVHLLGGRPIENFQRLWANIAWISCRECLLKAVVETVILFLRLDRQSVLKSAYKQHEYMDALGAFATGHPEIDFKSAFGQAFDAAAEGISQIGVHAEKCRISGRPMHSDRLVFARENITNCLQAK